MPNFAVHHGVYSGKISWYILIMKWTEKSWCSRHSFVVKIFSWVWAIHENYLLEIFCNEINSDKIFPDCSILVCYTIFVYHRVVSILDFGPRVIIMRPTHPCDIPIANYKIALIYRVNYEHWWKLYTYVMQLLTSHSYDN